VSRALRSWFAAAGIALAALLLHLAVQPFIHARLPFLFFLPAITLAAAVLGRGPALVVVAAGALNYSFWMPPVAHFWISSREDLVSLGLYLIVASVLVLLGNRLRFVSARAELAERRLALAQEDTGVGVFELDFSADTAFVSPSMCRMLAQPVVRMPVPLSRWLEMLDAGHVSETRRVLQQKVDRGELRYEREQHVRLPDGSWRWLLSRVQIDVTAEGRLHRARGAAVDITARKELDALLESTQAELRQQLGDLQRLHALSQRVASGTDDVAVHLQSVLDLIVDFHGARHGLLALHSSAGAPPRARASVGCDPALLPLLARAFAGDAGLCAPLAGGAERVVVADLVVMLAAMLAATTTPPAAAGIPDAALLREWSATTGVRAVHCRALRAAGGELLGVMVVMLEQSREPTTRELRLADICAATATNVIEREQADRRKNEFLATLAHELRGPLAPVRHAVHLLASDDPDPRRQQWGRAVIERQVQRMALLLDDLLDVSRITRGALELRIGRVELAALVETAIETARPLIDAKRHALEVALPAGSVLLAADPLRLSQALSNLLTNAAKYTDPGGRIGVEARLTDAGLSIVVRDSGIGLAPAAIPTLFEMFSQVDSVIDRAEGGLGIGLALVRGIVELHGGRVTAASGGPGCGSEFTLDLPPSIVASVDALAAPAARGLQGADRAGRPESRASAATGRILVADDNRDAAESLAMLLQLAGHEVFLAHSGAAALEVAGRERPDAAILDIGMPGLTGYQAATRIRAQHWGRGMLLLALTGWGQAADKALAAQSGFDHHMTKPVDPDEVERLVAQFLSGRRAAHAPGG
jgi:signal transduction histidine kinase/ActR/RegA family two-component response regulator/PAS domain-containing protein